MPSTSFYRRKFYRRGAKFYKRKTATLSRYNTYKNRSSAAQASQIYNLARRINNIQRLNKPEIKIAHANETYDFVFDGTAHRVVQTSSLLPATFVNNINGRFARLNSMTLTMSFRYDDPQIPEVISGDYSQRLPQPMYLRMLIVQTKATRQSGIAFEDVIDESTDFTAVRGPLADGAARVAKILTDKKYMINYNHQTVNKVIRFNYLRNYYKAPTEQMAKGDVRMFLICWNPNPAVVDATTNVIMNLNTKIAFTDA